MRIVIYICDGCQRKYDYEIPTTDKDPQPLYRVLNKEYCRQCLKKMVENI